LVGDEFIATSFRADLSLTPRFSAVKNRELSKEAV
jgi:hypothetical protein